MNTPTALEKLIIRELHGRSWDYSKLADRRIFELLRQRDLMQTTKDGIMVDITETVWSTNRPTRPGNYWMRRVMRPTPPNTPGVIYTEVGVGGREASMRYIDETGQVWPCDCQSTSPFDMTKWGEVEWAEVKEPE